MRCFLVKVFFLALETVVCEDQAMVSTVVLANLQSKMTIVVNLFDSELWERLLLRVGKCLLAKLFSYAMNLGIISNTISKYINYIIPGQASGAHICKLFLWIGPSYYPASILNTIGANNKIELRYFLDKINSLVNRI